MGNVGTKEASDDPNPQMEGLMTVRCFSWSSCYKVLAVTGTLKTCASSLPRGSQRVCPIGVP